MILKSLLLVLAFSFSFSRFATASETFDQIMQGIAQAQAGFQVLLTQANEIGPGDGLFYSLTKSGPFADIASGLQAQIDGSNAAIQTLAGTAPFYDSAEEQEFITAIGSLVDAEGEFLSFLTSRASILNTGLKFTLLIAQLLTTFRDLQNEVILYNKYEFPTDNAQQVAYANQTNAAFVAAVAAYTPFV